MTPADPVALAEALRDHRSVMVCSDGRVLPDPLVPRRPTTTRPARSDPPWVRGEPVCLGVSEDGWQVLDVVGRRDGSRRVPHAMAVSLSAVPGVYALAPSETGPGNALLMRDASCERKVRDSWRVFRSHHAVFESTDGRLVPVTRRDWEVPDEIAADGSLRHAGAGSPVDPAWELFANVLIDDVVGVALSVAGIYTDVLRRVEGTSSTYSRHMARFPSGTSEGVVAGEAVARLRELVDSCVARGVPKAVDTQFGQNPAGIGVSVPRVRLRTRFDGSHRGMRDVEMGGCWKPMGELWFPVLGDERFVVPDETLTQMLDFPGIFAPVRVVETGIEAGRGVGCPVAWVMARQIVVR